MLIKAVSGYSRKEAKRLDEGREQTRTGYKKARHTSITADQARALKGQPDTPQGRRDQLLICLLVDHGLRVGEVATLQVENFDLQGGIFTFYRPKVDVIQTHKLTTDTLRAALAYFQHDALPVGQMLRGSRKGGELEGCMSIRAIRERVRGLGAAIGVSNLSPHDLRHYWATAAARNKTDPFALQEAGGWSSLAMPRRYVEAATIANEGVKLSS
jgi:integrase